MKKSTTIIISILLIAVGIGYYFISRSHYDKTNTFYGYYTDARGLQSSGFVLINGVRVGKVADVELQRNQQVKVTLSIQKSVSILEGTIATITSDGLTGDRTVNLLVGKGAPLPEYATLKTGLDSTFVESFHAKVTPLLRTGKILLHTTDSTLQNVNYIMASGWGKRTQSDLEHTARNAASFARSSITLNRNTAEITENIHDLNQSLDNPVSKNVDINRSLSNVDQSMKDAAGNDLRQNMRELRDNINALAASVKKAGNNKAIHDKSTYQSATQRVDSLRQSLESYHSDPPPIQLLGGSKKK